MRSLTPAEASVVRSLLADEPVPHRERIRRSGLPARTYEVARRRLRISGWVVERFLPDPVRMGWPIARFVLAYPFAERFRGMSARWRERPGAVFVWEGPAVLFGVFFEAGGSAGDSKLVEGASRAFTLAADLREPSVPVYFDFEGAWSRLSGVAGTYRYPRPLAPLGDGPARARMPSSGDRAVVRQLVERPFEGPDSALDEPAGLFPRRRLRRAISEGLVEHRVFLDLTELPAFQGRRAESVVFLHGELREGRSAPALFRALVGRVAVNPFLFATDRRQVLAVSLSPAPPAGTPSGRGSVLATLEESLRSIEVVRVPVGDLATPVNHRYDRLVGESVGP